MSLLETLTEGIKPLNKKKEDANLVKKWKRYGLLENLGKWDRLQFSVMFENVAKELLSEISTMGGGNVEGYSTTLFPIIRRAYGKAIARKLVSMQAMSLPTQLVFFLDFVFNDNRLGNYKDQSVFGGGRVGAEIVQGLLTEDSGVTRYGERGFYSLNNGYTSATASVNLEADKVAQHVAPWQIGGSTTADASVNWDPDLASGSYATVIKGTLSAAQLAALPVENLVPILASLNTYDSGAVQVRRLTKRSGNDLYFVFHATASFDALVDGTTVLSLSAPLKDGFTAGSSLGTVVGTATWELENNTAIPELNVKISSVSIEAITRKIRTVWTPELEKDIQAYQSIDAEAELSGLMSDHVELEVNYEILEDLVKGATCGAYFWSRNPGKFVDKLTGADVSNTTTPPDFTGGIREWYQSLLETVNDLGALMQRKIRRGGPTFMVTSPEVVSILEMLTGFTANVASDDESGEGGVLKAGSIRKKWDVYVDPYFYRNVILIGRKGNSQIETGYAFCPYVPYYSTPTLFHYDSAVPRKIAWMRYGKKMLMPDMYGLIIIQDLLG
jgi:hypothetical protein